MKAKIHLEEVLSLKADSKGNIITTESSGLLKIINPSQSQARHVLPFP